MIHKYTAESLGLNRYKGLTLEQLFVQLCAWTTPYGSEHMLLSFFPDNCDVDEAGNIHYIITNDDGTDPIVQFCSHLDTACSRIQRVNIQRTGDIIHTDGTTVLSADCKIGVAIMLKMIEHGVPGWYVFHVGEEKGCVGAEWLAKNRHKWPLDPKISVEFDRHSYGSIITQQCMSRCCSEEFSKALASQLSVPGYKPFGSDDGGLYTDNYEYMGLIPEVTNISVGYSGHHTHKEKQDIKYANLLLKSLLKVDWKSLPIIRDPNGPKEFAGRHSYNFASGCYSLHKDRQDDTLYDTDKSDSIFPAPYRDSDGFYHIECPACWHTNDYTVQEFQKPFKFCQRCDEPLDAETYEELNYHSDNYNLGT